MHTKKTDIHQDLRALVIFTITTKYTLQMLSNVLMSITVGLGWLSLISLIYYLKQDRIQRSDVFDISVYTVSEIMLSWFLMNFVSQDVIIIYYQNIFFANYKLLMNFVRMSLNVKCDTRWRSNQLKKIAFLITNKRQSPHLLHTLTANGDTHIMHVHIFTVSRLAKNAERSNCNILPWTERLEIFPNNKKR